MPGHCHKMIRAVAQEAAGELYELLMSDNALYEEWKKQNPGLTAKQLSSRFITTRWGVCIPFARATLTLMLTKPIDDRVKESIMEALTLDATLIRGRVEKSQIVGVRNG